MLHRTTTIARDITYVRIGLGVGGVHKFTSAIFVVREPTKSTFSEYTREKTKGHVGRIATKSFKPGKFESDVVNTFAKTVRKTCENYFPEIEQLVGRENVKYVRFEEMLDKSTRSAALKKIATFLTNDAVTEHALDSAYADAEMFHRQVYYFNWLETVNARIAFPTHSC